MQSSTNTSSISLDAVLKQYYQQFESNPLQLFNQIPKQEYWRFFIDRGDQDLTDRLHFLIKKLTPPVDLEFQIYVFDKSDANLPLSEFLKKYEAWQPVLTDFGYDAKHQSQLSLIDFIDTQRGWSAYEQREPGYLKSMQIAFNYMLRTYLSTKGNKLSITFLKTLHHLAVSQVKKTNYDSYPSGPTSGNPGEIRNNYQNITYPLTTVNTTEAGLLELGKKIQTQFLPFLLCVELRAPDTETSVTSVPLKDIEDQPLSFTGYPVEEIMLEDLSDDEVEEVITNVYREYFSNPNPNPLYLVNIFSKDNNPREIFSSYMAFLLDNYNYELSLATSPHEKLASIVNLVQNLEQLHPFYDGNTRTFSMLLLNYLLITQGFPPTILDDPNRSGGNSKEEIIKEVIEGMQFSLNLANNQSNMEFTTEQLLEKLSKAQKDYFYSVIKHVIDLNALSKSNAFFSPIPAPDVIQSEDKKEHKPK